MPCGATNFGGRATEGARYWSLNEVWVGWWWEVVVRAPVRQPLAFALHPLPARFLGLARTIQRGVADLDLAGALVVRNHEAIV